MEITLESGGKPFVLYVPEVDEVEGMFAATLIVGGGHRYTLPKNYRSITIGDFLSIEKNRWFEPAISNIVVYRPDR